MRPKVLSPQAPRHRTPVPSGASEPATHAGLCSFFGETAIQLSSTVPTERQEEGPNVCTRMYIYVLVRTRRRVSRHSSSIGACLKRREVPGERRQLDETHNRRKRQLNYNRDT